MGFFKSSKSHSELLRDDCTTVADLAQQVRSLSERSLRGKYEYMQPEERARLVAEAHSLASRLEPTLSSARQRQETMEQDQCPSEELLQAQSLLLSANMDVTQAQKALDEARNSLVAGVAEVEEFYGASSKEARHLRRVLSQIQASA